MIDMFDRIIVSCAEPDLRDGLMMAAEGVREDFAPHILRVNRVDSISEVAALTAQLGAIRYLLIIDSRLGSSDVSAMTGFELVAKLQKTEQPPTCIVFCSDGNYSEISQIESMPLAAALEPSSTTDLGKACRVIAPRLAFQHASLMKSRLPPRKDGFALIDITIHDNCPDITLVLRVKEHGQPERTIEENRVRAKPKQLSAFVAKSQTIHDMFADRAGGAGSWLPLYQELGSEVHKLFKQNDSDDLWIRGQAMMPGATRVRFKLDDNLFEGCWESMYDPRNKRWFMIDAAMTRHAIVRHPAREVQVDGGDGTVHVLAVGSNIQPNSVVVTPPDLESQDYWSALFNQLKEKYKSRNGVLPRCLGDVFPSLANVEAEIDGLLHLSREIEADHHNGNGVKRFSVERVVSHGRRGNWSLFDDFSHILMGSPGRPRPRYDVIHFAGHAVFGKVGKLAGRGYLLFAGKSATRAVPISEFANMVMKAGVKMVYLSCCRSGAARAAFELASYGVPLSIGFQWDLDDKLATMFAGKFYDELVRNDLKVCDAIQTARNDIRAVASASDPTWAAPVLVSQSDDWSSIENGLAFRQPN